MKKRILLAAAVAASFFTFSESKAQTLNDQEYVAVTMDLQGILELDMTTNSQVDFVFNSIQKYQVGITNYNATRLEVNSTVPWDLYAQPLTQYWTQQVQYGDGTNAQAQLPSEILQLQVIQPNSAAGKTAGTDLDFNTFIGLSSNGGANVASLTPSVNTQYLAGMFGQGTNMSYAPGTATQSPLLNKFLVHYRIKPGIPANFPDLTSQYPSVSTATFTETAPYAAPGFYDLQIVYTLTEDL
ncbi:hypothetical protein [Pontibacter harenae]|uniref:hypothetical protein n=1 Tax=Pontibacter harenae TaxID=2894083 RepID=UPI001E577482|nr:hypothetical protein [Pontibacter harenae]MCC9166466.1 hypothetical protein [Pontibacter harenae]